MTDDKLVRETDVAAPVDLVWRVVTEPEHVGAWFGNGQPTRIDLRPGGRIVFDHVGHGDIPAVVQAVDPPHRYSYRWAVIGPPGKEPKPGNSTLVEFALSEAGEGTHLTITETGFTDVVAPEDELSARYQANVDGWGRALEQVKKHIEPLVTH